MPRRKISVCVILILFSSCLLNRDAVADERMKKIELQIKSGNYEQIYNESSEIVRNLVSKEEFIEKMNNAVGRMKNIDEALNFQKDENRDMRNGDVYGDLHFIYRKIEKNGKKLYIFVTFYFSGPESVFFDLCVDDPIETKVLTNEPSLCVTDAISKY